MEKDEVGLKLLGLTLLPHCKVWFPALIVPIKVRLFPTKEQLVNVLGAHVLSYPDITVISDGIRIEAALNPYFD